MTCAFAVRGALRKFSGVESVEVSLNKGLAAVKLKPGNTVSMADLWEAIRKNGYTPKTTAVVARGEIVAAGEKLQLKLTGSNAVYEIAPGSMAMLTDLKRSAGKTVTLEGTLNPAKDVKSPVPIQVQKVQQ
jgi:copper chaperone CopZ